MTVFDTLLPIMRITLKGHLNRGATTARRLSGELADAGYETGGDR